MMVKISPDNYINSDEITFMIAYGRTYAKEMYQEAKADDKLINLAGKRPRKTLILLKNGYLVVTELRAETIYRRINNLNDQ